ncbi:hypothetical protein HYV89_03200 [Candidatus Woesearchaeota archaeon]|nr:hypothetical protein [Candidatus Woesearchaeota archaeon]
MHKRGIEEITDNTIGILMTVLFVIVAGLILWNVLSVQACPAGYGLIEDYDSNPSMVDICGEKDSSGETTCCARKNNALEICKYNKSSDKKLDCRFLTEFNLGKVCNDNTACGVSTSECSGAYCEKGICLVKEGIGRCAEKFDIEGKEIAVKNNSCESEFDGVSIGSACSDGRHCLFDLFTRDGKCRGGYFNVNIEDAKSECRRLCKDDSSGYCTNKFPILVEGKAEPVDYDCRRLGVTCSSFQCKSLEQSPQL